MEQDSGYTPADPNLTHLPATQPSPALGSHALARLFTAGATCTPLQSKGMSWASPCKREHP